MSKSEQLKPACLISMPKVKNTGKTIIIFHGWESSVKNYVDFARSLSLCGFKAVVPELLFHDSRGRLENHFSKEITQEYFWKTIFSTIDEVDFLLDELAISKKDTLLLGVSMGGFIASGIYAGSQEFAGLISINGSGSFQLSEEIFREQDGRPVLSIEEIHRLNAYDPRHKDKPIAPVLLMHGERDSIVSIKGQEDYYAYLREGSSERDVTFLKYENVDHAISEDMTSDLIRWLEKRFAL